MPSIRETVQQALQQQGLASYQSQADPVISQLERREARIINRLSDYAYTELPDMDRDRIASVMRDCGLDTEAAQRFTPAQQYNTPADPQGWAPSPAQGQQQGQGDLSAQVAELTRQVQQLAQQMSVQQR